MLSVIDDPVEGEASTPVDTSIVKPFALEDGPEHYSDEGYGEAPISEAKPAPHAGQGFEKKDLK